MKVVFCIYDSKDAINGINAWLLRLLPALVKNHITVNVICMAWAHEADCTTIPILKLHGIKCAIIPLPHYTEKQVKWILKYLDTEKPDVFVPGNMVPALYASKWVHEAGIATVAILHNDDKEYEAIAEEFILKEGKTSLTAVVAVSKVLYQKNKIRCKNIKLLQIPYGATVPKEKSKYNKPFRVIYAGRIVQEQKRIAEITTSFCECAISIPGAEFYIYGAGPDTALVEEIISQYNSPVNMFFAGIIPNHKMREVLLDSHCIVLMSDYEGIPVILMEAMACGVVPICKNTESGISELLIDKKTGFFIEQPEDLIAKVKHMITHPESWEKMSVSCKELINDSFSETKNTSEWISLLNAINLKQGKSIKIPAKIKLPPSHPYLIDNDNRDPGLIHKAIRKLNRKVHTFIKSNAV